MPKRNNSGHGMEVKISNVRQQQVARSSGADSVLLKGFPAARFFEAVEMLTTERA